MKAQLRLIETASERLTDVSAELDRLAKRIDGIRSDVLAATVAAADSAEPVGRNSATPRTSVNVLAPVRSVTTRREVIAKVQSALNLTKKAAEMVTGAVVDGLEQTLIDNLEQDGFSIKLGSFGKFSIRHRPGSYHRIPLGDEMRMSDTLRKVKFVALGRLRQREKVGGGR